MSVKVNKLSVFVVPIPEIMYKCSIIVWIMSQKVVEQVLLIMVSSLFLYTFFLIISSAVD